MVQQCSTLSWESSFKISRIFGRTPLKGRFSLNQLQCNECMSASCTGNLWKSQLIWVSWFAKVCKIVPIIRDKYKVEIDTERFRCAQQRHMDRQIWFFVLQWSNFDPNNFQIFRAMDSHKFATLDLSQIRGPPNPLLNHLADYDAIFWGTPNFQTHPILLGHTYIYYIIPYGK